MGVEGEELTAAAKRGPVAQKSLIVKKGRRIPLTVGMFRATDSANMGAFGLSNADAHCLYLSDFHPAPIGELETLNIAGCNIGETRGKTGGISEPTNAARRQILFVEGIYGLGHGKQRKDAHDVPPGA